MNHGSSSIKVKPTPGGMAVYSSDPSDPNLPASTVVIHQNQELVFEYGAHANCFLAAEYGFVLAENPHASVDATLKVLELFKTLPQPDLEQKLALLEEYGYKE